MALARGQSLASLLREKELADSVASGSAVTASEDRTALDGLERRLFKLVSTKATSAQWAEWLRAPLEHAVAEGDKDLALSLLKAGANGGAGWKGCDGRTLLDAAAEGGNEDVVSTLLKVGGSTDLNAVSGAKHMTPLLRACKGGHTAAAQALLVEGAVVGLADSDQRSALHYALQGGHQSLASLVLIAGADLNAKDRAGNTPLHLAAALEDDKLVCTLLRKGARVDVTNNRRQCALHSAVVLKRVRSAEALLEAGADPNARYTGADPNIRYTGGAQNSNQYSPLVLARRNLAMTKLLLQHGADLNAQGQGGYTALHYAAESGSVGVIDALVDGGANVEARSSSLRLGTHPFKGLSPLHTAACNKLESTAVLLRRGANVNAKDDDGLTPLHVLCKTSARFTSAPKTADVLLRGGADETITDNDGNTPKDLIENGSKQAPSLRRLLANAPADRMWRRRGMLVLCRALSTKVPGADREWKPGKVLCRGKEIRARSASSGHPRVLTRVVGLDVLTRVVGLDVEDVFRSIVTFL
eukprot:g15321.t1